MSDENLNVIDPNASLGDLAKMMEIDVPQETLEDEGIKNTGFSFYQHKPGNYVALIGMLGNPTWVKEVEGKKKKFTEPEAGAIKSYCMLPFMIIEDPEGKLVDDTFTPKEGITYGQLVWQQYCSLLGDKQFGNKRLFQHLRYDNLPQLDIVQGGDNDYNIKLEILKHFYYGAPVTFTLDKAGKAKGVWIVEDTLNLRNTVLTKDAIAKRKMVAGTLWEKIQAIKEAEEAERKARKGDADAESMAPSQDDTKSADSMLNDGGFNLEQ